MNPTVIIALEMMGKGMTGIFVGVLLITLAVIVLGKLK